MKILLSHTDNPELLKKMTGFSLYFEKIDCQNIFATVNGNLTGLAIYYRDSLTVKYGQQWVINLKRV